MLVEFHLEVSFSAPSFNLFIQICPVLFHLSFLVCQQLNLQHKSPAHSTASLCALLTCWVEVIFIRFSCFSFIHSFTHFCSHTTFAIFSYPVQKLALLCFSFDSIWKNSFYYFAFGWLYLLLFIKLHWK